MRNRKLARRYAEALGELAFSQNVLDEVENDLALVRQTILEQPALARLLEDVNTSDERKDSVIREIFEGRLGRIPLNFVRLVVAKRRGEYLVDMIDAFHEYANEKRGIMEVEVTTAAPLGQQEEQALSEKLSQITGCDVKLIPKEDVSLIGGVVVKIGDLVMDGSLKTRLESLRESLLKAQLN